MPLTRQQAKKHAEACALLELESPLTWDQKVFILDHIHEAGDSNNVLNRMIRVAKPISVRT